MALIKRGPEAQRVRLTVHSPAATPHYARRSSALLARKVYAPESQPVRMAYGAGARVGEFIQEQRGS
ncbi:hypothetical protein GCM10023086_74920 [Streptomyces venetus]|uniref:Uncharacterized protein n=1 Tax=Streptomyces venetus TaxID=1701086 RepID=A0ABP8HIL6_9ACTN